MYIYNYIHTHILCCVPNIYYSKYTLNWYNLHRNTAISEKSHCWKSQLRWAMCFGALENRWTARRLLVFVRQPRTSEASYFHDAFAYR